MKILIACEFSGIVRDSFINRGHDAISCDLLPSETSGPHYQGNVLDLLDYPFDMMIAFPPCTHLAVSGAAHFEKKKMDGSQYAGASFFMKLARAPIEKIAIENPVGIMSNLWRTPDQIIHPYYFGDSVCKKTCLWLKNLPPLIHLKEDGLFQKKTHVEEGKYVVSSSGKRYPEWCWKTGGGQGKKRSVFYKGIAEAMAEQWGKIK